MAKQPNSSIELLTLLVDSNDEEESEYRFLVDGKYVKYVTVEPGALPKDDRTFAPILIPMLPPFPPGDWNEGHIAKDKSTGNLIFSRTKKSNLPSVQNSWHGTKLDHLEFTKIERIRQNIKKVSHPNFDHPVVIKFAEFPWQMPFIEAETTAYQWIDGQEVGPKFLGHLTEDGRIFGFIMEYLEGAKEAVPEDLPACLASLKRLHSLGIKHGDTNKYNFVMQNGKAILIDFETAKRCECKADLDMEWQNLEASLNNPSFIGGRGPAVLSHTMPFT